MKLKRLLFVAVGLMAIALAHATSWRINPDPKAKAQFKTVAEAMEDKNVQPGDILLLDPGFYGDFEVTKDNIAIVGTGYLLDQNKGWSETGQAVIGAVKISNVGCSIEGCSFTSNVDIDASNFSLKRCMIARIGNATRYGLANVIVEQCLVNGTISLYGNTILKNNIIHGQIFVAGEGNIIENNTIVFESYDGDRGCLLNIDTNETSILRNNIIIDTNPDNHRIFDHRTPKIICTMYNNVTSSKAGDEDDKEGNINIGATVESTFINEGSPDGKWRLKANSPAKGAASNGDDCGAFGGKDPYVLSGLPKFVPHITNIDVPARPTAGKLTIKLKIENQDE